MLQQDFLLDHGVGLLKKSPVGGPLPKQVVQIDVAKTGKPLLKIQKLEKKLCRVLDNLIP